MKIIRFFLTRTAKAQVALDSVQAAIGAKWLWLATFALSFLACETVASIRYAYTSIYFAYKEARIEESLGYSLAEPLVDISFLTEYFVPAVGWAVGLTVAIFIVITFSRENGKTENSSSPA